MLKKVDAFGQSHGQSDGKNSKKSLVQSFLLPDFAF